MYGLNPDKTATVQYTPREWTRYLLRLSFGEESEALPTQDLICFILVQLTVSERYPGDKIAAAATPREAALIAAQMRHHAQGVR